MRLRATQPCLCRREGWLVAGAEPVRLLLPPWGAGCGVGGSVQGAAHNRPGALPAARLNPHPGSRYTPLESPEENRKFRREELDAGSHGYTMAASMTPALFFFIFIYIYVGVELVYRVVLTLGVQQYGSVIYIHGSILF